MSFNQITNGSVLYNEDWESLAYHYHTGAERDGELLTKQCFSQTQIVAGIPQNAFQLVQAVNFTNGGRLAADVYTDSNGRNNTVTGGTGSFYSNNYVCPLSAGSYVNSTVIHSGLLALDSNTGGFVIYGRTLLEPSTTITATVSNGTITHSGLELNTSNIASLKTGSLILTFNLNTTNKANTPHLYGYGVYLLK